MPKPKPSPKRTNWKQAYERISAKIQHAEENRDYYLKRWTLAEEKLKKTEAHNAELLKEREALVKPLSDNCHDCGMSLIGSVAERQIALCTPCSDARDRIKQQPPTPSWLRRNWVELTVMATVLGAIAFIVWRAWH